MTMSLVPDPVGDPRNALFLALACDLAYLSDTEGQAAFHEQLGLEARLLSVGNTQVYLAANEAAIVLAFRGTESPASVEGLKDWLLTNALNLLVLPQGRLGTDFAAAGVGARFHQGFLNALATIWDPISEFVDTELAKSERPLWITGHSLGGALATLAGWLFLRRMIPIHAIFTFGAPMVGNDKAMEAFDRELGPLTYRYVDIDDPIPRLPAISLIANAYKQCNQEKLLGNAASAMADSLGLFHRFAGQAVHDLLHGTLIDEVWAEVNRRVACHMMDNYQKKIRGE
jgi:hypothetical protein